MAPATALEALQAQLRACRVPPLPPAAAAGSPQHLLPLLSHLLLAFSKHVARSVAEHGLQVCTARGASPPARPAVKLTARRPWPAPTCPSLT